MKIKKKSIIIPAFALLIGASLAGSITGTVAWYQYSTRTNAAYLGVSGGTTGNLQMRIKGQEAWQTTFSVNDINEYIASDTLNTAGYGKNIVPVTSGAMGKDDALPANMYANPKVGVGPYANWDVADNGSFLRIPLQLRYVERDGNYQTIGGKQVDEEEAARDVYLSDLLIQEDVNSENADLSNAIRFHIYSFEDDSAETGEGVDHIKDGSKLNRLVSKQGGNTVVQGKLDLDGNGLPDKGYQNGGKYGNFNSANTLVDVVYGQDPEHPNDVASQISYHAREDNFDIVAKEGEKYFDQNNTLQNATEDIYPIVVEESGDHDLEKLSYTVGETTTSKAIGKTLAKNPTAENYETIKDDYLNVEITIWVEGWQKFVLSVDETDPQNPVDQYNSVWKADYINAAFNVGFEFGVDADSTTL